MKNHHAPNHTLAYLSSGLALVLTLVVVSLVVLGGVALQQRERIARLEKQIEVEQRHGEHLTLAIERLRDRAAGIEPEPDAPMVGVVIHLVGKPGLKHERIAPLNLERPRPHAPAWFTPGDGPIRRDASGGLASADREVEPDGQGEPPWPLVRREPKTAQAGTADIVGGLPSFTLQFSASMRASRPQGGKHDAPGPAGAIADEGRSEAGVRSLPEDRCRCARLVAGDPVWRVFLDRNHQATIQTDRRDSTRSMHDRCRSARGRHNHRGAGYRHWRGADRDCRRYEQQG
jgi:hypothetical protein